MSSRLLSLPAELRNKVYELVLSEAEGLEYVNTGAATGRLYLRTTGASPNVNVEEISGHPKAVSTPHALSTSATGGRQIIANQLQYVCRQLRRETKGLEILYNTIVFTRTEPDAFMGFVHELPPFFHAHTYSIIIKRPLEGWKSDMFRGLRKFARAYPQCSVKYHHPELRVSTPLSVLFTTVLVKYGARKDTSYVKRLTNCRVLQQRILEMLPKQVKKQLVDQIPPNITLFPYDTFDESAFRKACNEQKAIRDVLAPTLTNGVDDLVAMAKDTYTYGF